MVEASAIILALKHARDLGFDNLSFASDSSSLVKAINSEIHPKELHGIHYDILHLSLLFDAISFRFVPRSANYVANSMAKKVLSSAVTGLTQY